MKKGLRSTTANSSSVMMAIHRRRTSISPEQRRIQKSVKIRNVTMTMAFTAAACIDPTGAVVNYGGEVPNRIDGRWTGLAALMNQGDSNKAWEKKFRENTPIATKNLATPLDAIVTRHLSVTNTPSISPAPNPKTNFPDIPTGVPSILSQNQPSLIPSNIPTHVPSALPQNRPSLIPSTQPSSTLSIKPTGKPSIDPSSVPTLLPTLLPSLNPSSSPSLQPSSTPQGAPSSIPSSIPTALPSIEPSDTPAATPSVKPSRIPSIQPTSGPTSKPSVQPTGGPTSKPSVQPMWTPSASPSVIPSDVPSHLPTRIPSVSLTGVPSNISSNIPTRMLSVNTPSVKPSVIRSIQPTSGPTSKPSVQPMGTPSASPSVIPSDVPSHLPTRIPSVSLTSVPSNISSNIPTRMLSVNPTDVPSTRPFSHPSSEPSLSPTTQPSSSLSLSPILKPSNQPTVSSQPSSKPSALPSTIPTIIPSNSPTISLETILYAMVSFDNLDILSINTTEIFEKVTDDTVKAQFDETFNSTFDFMEVQTTVVNMQRHSFGNFNSKTTAGSGRPIGGVSPSQSPGIVRRLKLVRRGGSSPFGQFLDSEYRYRQLQESGTDLLIAFNMVVSIRTTISFTQEGLKAEVESTFNTNDKKTGYIFSLQEYIKEEEAFDAINRVAIVIDGEQVIDKPSVSPYIEEPGGIKYVAIIGGPLAFLFICAGYIVWYRRRGYTDSGENLNRNSDFEDRNGTGRRRILFDRDEGLSGSSSSEGITKRVHEQGSVDRNNFEEKFMEYTYSEEKQNRNSDFEDRNGTGRRRILSDRNIGDRTVQNEQILPVMPINAEEFRESKQTIDNHFKSIIDISTDDPCVSTLGDSQSARNPLYSTFAFGGADGDDSVPSAAGRNSAERHGSSHVSSLASSSDRLNISRENVSQFTDDESSVHDEKIEVTAPADKLGLVIDTPMAGVPIVYAIKYTSILMDVVNLGDKLVSVDGLDTTKMSALRVSNLIGSKGKNKCIIVFERALCLHELLVYKR